VTNEIKIELTAMIAVTMSTTIIVLCLCSYTIIIIIIIIIFIVYIIQNGVSWDSDLDVYYTLYILSASTKQREIQ